MEKILLIEDSLFICGMVKKTLANDKTEVISSPTAEYALELLERITPELILMGAILPDISGYELCRRFKCNNKLKNVPILFITANSDVNSIVRGFKAGATDYICKPFSTAELVARVTCHLQNKRMSDELFRTNQQLLLMMEDLRLRSCRDSLTDSYNRRYFLENIGVWRKRMESESACLFMVDIDYFKEINDSYGHTTGDYVLHTIAGILKRSIEDESVVIRWGGDEFLIILFRTTLEIATITGKQISDTVSNYRFTHGGRELHCSLTMGITNFYTELTVEENLNLADRALYIGKEKGRNCCVNESELELLPR